LTMCCSKLSCGLLDDYWSDDFDTGKKCKGGETIKRLLGADPDSGHCAVVSVGTEKMRWEECKRNLAAKLVMLCIPRNIEKTGDLLYCNERGTTSCCFQNEVCGADMVEINNKMLYNSINYLKNKEKYLSNLVDKEGYDSCHPIRGYDASVCEQDCKKLQESEFARNCSKNNGLYKCCIRFCCTLSVCTNMAGTYFKDTKMSEAQNSTIVSQATTGFLVDNNMWKNKDFRCLKPKKGLDPSKWPHYEMHSFRTARSKEELDRVKEIQFDKNFFNLEDPQVWNAMLDRKKGPKIWRKTYGYDYVSLVEGLDGEANYTKCYIHCFKAEQGRFAKKCKRDGGLFKCCMIGLQLNPFEEVRKLLRKARLISSGPTEKTARCEKNWYTGYCNMCGVTQICARKDKITNRVVETFKTPYTMQHKIGGRFLNKGLKYLGCFGMNTCLKHGNNAMYEPLTEYQNAVTVEDFCNLTQKISFLDMRNETYQASFLKECMNQTSPNVFICPNKKFHKIADKNMTFTTNILKEMDQKLRDNKKTEKKKIKRKKKKE